MAHSEFDYSENFFRCYFHSTRALHRGDYPNAVKWIRLAERHMAIARCYEDLAGQRHKPSKQKAQKHAPQKHAPKQRKA